MAFFSNQLARLKTAIGGSVAVFEDAKALGAAANTFVTDPQTGVILPGSPFTKIDAGELLRLERLAATTGAHAEDMERAVKAASAVNKNLAASRITWTKGVETAMQSQLQVLKATESLAGKTADFLPEASLSQQQTEIQRSRINSLRAQIRGTRP